MSESKTNEFDTDDVSVYELFQKMSDIDEAILLGEHGYVKQGKICETLQGTLFKAKTSNDSKQPRNVAIKVAQKEYADQNESKPIDGFHFCVAENIVEESKILKHLNLQKSFYSSYIVKYIDFFESKRAYYLVMEYMESGLTLRAFVRNSHALINADLLSFVEYVKIIKFLLWQLFATVAWMHRQMHCCHLDLNLDNVMVQNARFIQGEDGTMSIHRGVEIKIIDFGVSQLFPSNDFSCSKWALNVHNEAYLAPEIVCEEETYNAIAADSWSLGVIMFECLTNRPLYNLDDVKMTPESELCGDLPMVTYSKQLLLTWNLVRCKLIKYFSPSSFTLLSQLLMADGEKRLSAADALKCKWFQSYFQFYSPRIANALRL